MVTTNENKKLDEELKSLLQEVPEEDLEKKISRLINKRIRIIVLKVLLVAAVISTVLFFGISPVMNAAHYDPSDEENHLEEVLRYYVELCMPWREVYRNQMRVEKKGFGNYDVGITVLDKTNLLIIGGSNVSLAIDQGELKKESDPQLLLTQVVSRFDMTEDALTKAEVNELPSSAMLYLSVSLEEAVPLDALRNLDVTVEWIQVDQPAARFQGGLCLNSATNGNDSILLNMTDEQLLQFYCDHMEMLLDHDEIWRQLPLMDGRGIVFSPVAAKEVLQETYEDALTLNEVKVENFCVYGKRDQIAELYDQFSFDSIYVENVRVLG